MTEQIFARMPTAEEADLLKQPAGEPVVELHRTTYTADGTVVEFTLGVHAASRFAWEYDFKCPTQHRTENPRDPLPGSPIRRLAALGLPPDAP
jgi:hypothetical protein